MGRRLVFGTVGRQRLAELYPLAIVNGHPVFPIKAAEADDDDSSKDEDHDETEDDDDSDDEDDEAKDDDPPKRRRRSRTDVREFNRLKREAATLKREKAEREKKDREAELATKSEVERAAAERDDAVKERDELREKYRAASVELEIIRASHGKYEWVDIEDVLADRAVRKAVEIDDNGEITGTAEALKDLAKRKPHFLKSKSGEDDDKGKSGNSRPPANTGNGNGGNGKSGGNPGPGGNDPRAADRQRLNQLYPALARLGQ